MSDFRPFHFKWHNTLLMIIIVMISLSLSYWQYQRVQEKKQLMTDYQNMLQSEPSHLNSLSTSELAKLNQEAWLKVSAEGEFLKDFAFFLDSQVYQGRPGYHFIVPMKLSHSDYAILVNLGWVAAGTNRQKIPDFPEVDVEQPVIGQLSSPRTATPGIAEQDNQNAVKLFINLSKLSEQIQYPLVPMMLLLDEEAKGGLPRSWPAFDAKVGMHKFYVAHWLIVALLSNLLYIYFGYKQPRTNP